MQVHTSLNNQTNLFCTNCLIPLNQSDHKQHYKSEFHRYNIKRKILGLKPATEEQFNTKKGNQNTGAQQNVNGNGSGNGKGFECGPCRKTFTNDGVYKQHLQSKKHQQKVQKQTTTDRKSKQSEPRVATPELCLFCDFKSPCATTNQSHMSITHGFFIPQREFCTDIPELFSYLHQKVDVGLLCLYCDNKGYKEFSNGGAIRSHMKDKRHCFMNITNGFEEFEDYYDFGKLFDERVEDQKGYKFIPGLESDIVEVELERKEKKVKEVKEESKEEIKDSKQEGDDDDWEDEQDQNQDGQWSDASGEDGQQISQAKQQPQPKTKKYTMYKPTVVSSGQLLLPSGKLIGTRKYRNLYKQYYRPTVRAQNLSMLTGMPYSTDLVLKSEKLEFFRKQERQIRGSKLFEKNRDLKLKLRMNKLQYHFRCQTPK